MLTHISIKGRKSVDNNNSGSIENNKIYKKRAKLALVFFLDLKLELKFILVSTSSTLFVCFILFTDYLTTNYYPKKNINNFDLRKLFYSR